MMKPKISIIMPCYNRGHELTRVLRAYDAQDFGRPFELIAIDDGSTDNTLQVLQSYRPTQYTLRAERQPTNQGPAAARNRGLALAQSPLILFVGDDILPSPSFVRRHVEAHRERPDPHVAILGHIKWADDLPQNTLMKHIDGIGAQQFSYHYLQSGQEYDYRHFYTANISLKRALLLSEPVWFDTSFPYAAFEDVELAYRLAKRGLRIIYLKHLTCQHYHYHTIWSFARRQYQAGRMAWHLIRKHPPTARHILRLRPLMNALLTSRKLSRTSERTEPESVEETALHLASFYEWSPNPLLDTLYLNVLDYFYCKGILQELTGNHFPQRWPSAHEALVRHHLIPALQRFIQRALALKIPLPLHEIRPHLLNAS